MCASKGFTVRTHTASLTFDLTPQDPLIVFVLWRPTANGCNWLTESATSKNAVPDLIGDLLLVVFVLVLPVEERHHHQQGADDDG